MFDIAIIGGGFSGTALLCHLPKNLSVAILEPGKFGRGLAYGVNSPYVILNVPASRMSLYQNDPDSFLKWLDSRNVTDTSFVSRKLYGEYLSDQLSNRTFELFKETAYLLEKKTFGFLINNYIKAKHVVIATGNSENTIIKGENIIPISRLLDGEKIDLSVKRISIIGSSLSAHDAIIELRSRGFIGELLIISRHGLTPKIHPPTFKHSDPTEITFSSLLECIKYIRKESKRTSDWIQVLDSFRVITPLIWQRFSLKEKEYFLKRVKTYWDIHRHRIPPINHKFKIKKGTVINSSHEHGKVKIHLKSGEEILSEYVVDASGISWEEKNPFIVGLFKSGIAKPSFKLGGIVTDKLGRVIDNMGSNHLNLFALGPVRRGDLLETTAVREIREQAFNLANFFDQHYQMHSHSLQERI